MTYNFTIGGLGFHKLVNDEHPYERATAPFRKEQFDTAPKVGDQSLTGWWTRGQLSFHEGAGVNYYEVLDGEEVLHRYSASVNVNTSTPGVVTLAPELESQALNGIRRMVAITSVSRERYLFWRSDDTLYGVVPGAGAAALTDMMLQPVTMSAGKVPKALAGDVAMGYVVTEDGGGVNRIEHWVPDSASLTTAWAWQLPADCRDIFYKKGRLWAVTMGLDSWNFYMMDWSGPGTLTSADSFGSALHGDSAEMLNLAGSWSAAEGPGAVYFALSNKIYIVDIDESGAVPVPSPPRVVATLPSTEKVGAIEYAAGYLSIATTYGFRFAAIGDNGNITLGPLLAEGVDFSATVNVAVRGTEVHLLGQSSEHGSGVYAINLRFIDENMVAPWYLRHDSGYAGSVSLLPTYDYRGGVFYGPVSGTWVWSRNYVDLHRYANANLSATGSVTTGLHRFGTLEWKHFSGVTVRCGGDGGTITVYAVTPQGVETELTTVDVAESDGADVSLVVNPPVESVALKFVLARDATDPTVGPKLLGYQLKALPSPVRQRLIRVPLMLFDTERGPTGRAIGAEKSAWTRLAALEALEESDALVEFEDSETGESGTAYIETVEVMRVNGSSGNSRSNGFGGVVTVTLRKVA